MKPGFERASAVRNLSWLGTVSVAVKPLWFIFITFFCIRAFGDAGYGAFNWALMVMAIAASFTEFGTTSYSTREVARTPEQASLFLSNIVVFRLALTALVVVIVLAVTSITGEPLDRVTLLLTAGAYAIGLSTLEYCRSLFRSFEVLRYEAISVVAEKAAVIGLGIAAIAIWGTPGATLTAMAAGVFITLALTLAVIHRRFAAVRLSSLDADFVKRMVLSSLPIGLFGLLAVAYLRVGPFVLEYVHGEAALGRFSAAFRVIEALLILPALAAAVVLPRVSRLHGAGATRDMKRFAGRALIGMGGVATFAAIALILSSDILINLLSGGRAEFDESPQLLRYLALAYPLMSINTLLAVVIIAIDGQRGLVGAMVLGLAAVSVGNVAMVPTYGAVAVCIVLLITEVIVLSALLFIFFRRHATS